MPVLHLHSEEIPTRLRGPVAVNNFYVPYFYATIWADVLRAKDKNSTRAEKLSAVDGFYRFVAGRTEADLDDILTRADFTSLENELAGYLTHLRAASEPFSVASERRWSTTLKFVCDVLDVMGASSRRKAEFQSRMMRLERLYGQLSPTGPRPPEQIRALPLVVVEDCYAVFNPTSNRNPFRTDVSRWRNFAIFLLLLHLGVRRGELLALNVDSIKGEFDLASGETRYWINVEVKRAAEDSRALKPELKTAYSRRAIPLTRHLAELLLAYLDGYRGRARHPFLFSSQKEMPLSAPMLSSILRKASEALSTEAQAALANRDRAGVSAHDLRHTAVVARLQRYRATGVPHEEAMEKLRGFFGWSRSSKMPLHYGRAYFEPTFAEVWTETFEDYVTSIRQLEGDAE